MARHRLGWWFSPFEYTRIPAGMRFFEVIMSPSCCVDRHGETLYRGDDTTALRWGDARA